MASKACEKELNAQLQALDARVKQTEKNVAALSKAVSAVAKTASTALGNTPDPFTTALAAMGNAGMALWQSFVNSIPSIDADIVQNLMMQAAIEALGQASLPFDMVDAITGNLTSIVQGIEADIANVKALLEIDPENETLKQELLGLLNSLTHYQDAIDTLNVVSKAVNNISQCKTGSYVIS